MVNKISKSLSDNRLLKNVEIADLDLSEVKGELLSKNSGEVIYREGDAANFIYLVVSGEVNVISKKNLDKTKSVTVKEGDFFGNEEFFEEESRANTATTLKDSYLIKLTEEEIQSLIQQDTIIYENLRELSGDALFTDADSGGIPGSADDFDLKMDSELAGINIDDLSSDDNDLGVDLPAESAEVKHEEPENDFGETDDLKSGLDDIDDDILNALDSEPDYNKTEEEVDSAMNSLNDDDAAFFQNFGSDIPMEEDSASSTDTSLEETSHDTADSSPPPLKPKGLSSNDLINFDFDDEKDDSIDDLLNLDKDENEEINEETDSDDYSETSSEVEDDSEAIEDTKTEVSVDKEKIIEEINTTVESRKSSDKQNEGEQMTAEDLEMINKAAQLVNSNIKLDDVLKNIVDVATSLTKADRGTLYLVDSDSNELWSKIAMGDNIKEIRLKIGEGVAGWVAESKETVNIEDVKEDSRFHPLTDKGTGYETKNMLCFPIQSKDKNVVGVLQLLNSENGKFSKLDEEFLNALSIHAALALENAEMLETLLQGERVNSLGKMANFLIQDIKKPVLVSKRYAEHLRGKELSPEVIQVLDMMLEQLNQVADLVQTTSSYAEGKKILHQIDVDFAEILDDFSNRMEQYVQLKRCTIVNNLDAKAKIRLDVKEFFQCYSHIVKNACDAMPDGGRITVTLETRDDKAVVSMRDEGLGIADTIKEKIFEPFTTHGKKEGTGLGLAITKKIVEAHGGTVGVESSLGEGATFLISIPLNK